MELFHDIVIWCRGGNNSFTLYNGIMPIKNKLKEGVVQDEIIY